MKYGYESRERLRWRSPVATENYRLDLSSERAPASTSKNNERRKEKNGSRVPNGSLPPRQAGRLTAGRNIILALTTGISLRHDDYVESALMNDGILQSIIEIYCLFKTVCLSANIKLTLHRALIT
jgi:hypothetical protein